MSPVKQTISDAYSQMVSDGASAETRELAKNVAATAIMANVKCRVADFMIEPSWFVILSQTILCNRYAIKVKNCQNWLKRTKQQGFVQKLATIYPISSEIIKILLSFRTRILCSIGLRIVIKSEF